MDIAALIISVLSLLLSISVSIIMVAKHYFSSHVIQYQPVESAFPTPMPTGKPMEDAFRDFDQLTPEEEEYFRKQKSNI